MSSILKALKKAENRPPTKIENRFWQYSWNTPKPQSIPDRKNNIVLWIICVLLGINILVAGGRYLWPGKSETPAPNMKSELLGVPVEERAAVPVLKAASIPTADSQSASPPQPMIRSHTVLPHEDALPNLPSKTQKIASKKEFDFSGYRLEGLVFTDSSKDTFAVINGEIVRKGDVVGEVRVTKIQSKYVEIQSKDGAFVSRLNLY